MPADLIMLLTILMQQPTSAAQRQTAVVLTTPRYQWEPLPSFCLYPENTWDFDHFDLQEADKKIVL